MKHQFKVILSQEAREDFIAAYEWYEDQTPGLGDRFEKEFELVISKLKNTPQIFQRIFLDARSAQTSKFPYSLIFDVDESNYVVNVFGVIHQGRNPWTWIKRIQ